MSLWPKSLPIKIMMKNSSKQRTDRKEEQPSSLHASKSLLKFFVNISPFLFRKRLSDMSKSIILDCDNIESHLVHLFDKTRSFFVEGSTIKDFLCKHREKMHWMMLKCFYELGLQSESLLLSFFVSVRHFIARKEVAQQLVTLVAYLWIGIKFVETIQIDIEDILDCLITGFSDIDSRKLFVMKKEIMLQEAQILNDINYCLWIPPLMDHVRLIWLLDGKRVGWLRHAEVAFIENVMRKPEIFLCRKDGVELTVMDICSMVGQSYSQRRSLFNNKY